MQVSREQSERGRRTRAQEQVSSDGSGQRGRQGRGERLPVLTRRQAVVGRSATSRRGWLIANTVGMLWTASTHGMRTLRVLWVGCLGSRSVTCPSNPPRARQGQAPSSSFGTCQHAPPPPLVCLMRTTPTQRSDSFPGKLELLVRQWAAASAACVMLTGQRITSSGGRVLPGLS